MKNLKHGVRIMVVALLGLAAVGCASTTYSPYEGGGILQGTGGTKKIVDGMEIWSNGTPPRKFKIAGVIDDERQEGLITMMGYEKSLVKTAKEAGGDAIIFYSTHSEVTGYSTSYAGTGSSASAVKNKVTKVVVIKYVE